MNDHKAGSGATDQPHSLEFAVPRLFVPVPSLTSSKGAFRAGLTLNNCRAQIKRKFIQDQENKKQKTKVSCSNNCQSWLYSNRGPPILLSSKLPRSNNVISGLALSTMTSDSTLLWAWCILISEIPLTCLRHRPTEALILPNKRRFFPFKIPNLFVDQSAYLPCAT